MLSDLGHVSWQGGALQRPTGLTIMNSVLVAPGGLLPKGFAPVFMAGPVGGAGPWRSELAGRLRLGVDGGRVAFVDPGAPAAFSISVGARVAWEQGMLDASLQRGLLIMWLGEQREATKMLERFPRPFGLASMLELGWVSANYGVYDSRRLQIGISESFPSSDYVRQYLATRIPEAHLAWTLAGLASRCVAALKALNC